MWYWQQYSHPYTFPYAFSFNIYLVTNHTFPPFFNLFTWSPFTSQIPPFCAHNKLLYCLTLTIWLLYSAEKDTVTKMYHYLLKRISTQLSRGRHRGRVITSGRSRSHRNSFSSSITVLDKDEVSSTASVSQTHIPSALIFQRDALDFSVLPRIVPSLLYLLGTSFQSWKRQNRENEKDLRTLLGD